MSNSVFRSRRIFALACSLAVMEAFIGSSALAQGPKLQEQIVGTWSIVAVIIDQGGAPHDVFGPNPKGVATFGSDGRYSLTLLRADLPKIASNKREAGTPEENKAITGGTLAHFGRYSVSESDRTINFEVEASSFPNWNGAKQIRLVTRCDGDVLKWTNPASSQGTGSSNLTWSRAK